MNWISNVVRPRIRGLLNTKREVPDNMWVQCPESGQMVFHKDLEANSYVVPGSNFHMRVSAQDRLTMTFDDGAFEPIELPDVPLDPLKFRDGKRYTDRLKEARSKSGLTDAVLAGSGQLAGRTVVIAAQDFRFMGGSLGMAAGEAVVAAMERALELVTPFILFAASGGARMQEGILSLMQMPRTTIAVQKLREAGLPYLVVLTDPTTGGVTASYAMLGDVHIAEPGALICFAGPRVIEQTIREQLPDGFQRAEYLYEHGMIDMVVHRHKMRDTLASLCRVLGPQDDHPLIVSEVEHLPPPDNATASRAPKRANGHDPDGTTSMKSTAGSNAQSATKGAAHCESVNEASALRDGREAGGQPGANGGKPTAAKASDGSATDDMPEVGEGTAGRPAKDAAKSAPEQETTLFSTLGITSALAAIPSVGRRAEQGQASSNDQATAESENQPTATASKAVDSEAAAASGARSDPATAKASTHKAGGRDAKSKSRAKAAKSADNKSAEKPSGRSAKPKPE